MNDLTLSGRNLTATGTQRPTISGGVLTFNGTTNYMFHTSPFMYAAGALTIVATFKSQAVAVGSSFIGEGASATGNPLYQLLRSDGLVAAGTGAFNFIRNDAAANIALNTVNLGITAFNNTKQVASITDTGSIITGYLNGNTGATPQSYTRSGTLTLNRWALGALVRNTVSGYLPMEFNRIDIFTRVLTTPERQGVEKWQAERFGVTY
jgi:hypothetical protein